MRTALQHQQLLERQVSYNSHLSSPTGPMLRQLTAAETRHPVKPIKEALQPATLQAKAVSNQQKLVGLRELLHLINSSPGQQQPGSGLNVLH
jgi:hypothetical protein